MKRSIYCKDERQSNEEKVHFSVSSVHTNNVEVNSHRTYILQGNHILNIKQKNQINR